MDRGGGNSQFPNHHFVLPRSANVEESLLLETWIVVLGCLEDGLEKTVRNGKPGQ